MRPTPEPRVRTGVSIFDVPKNRLAWCLQGLGLVLALGGLGHTFGVLRLYVTTGVPEANRVLLHIWVAEAQLVAGAFYLCAGRALIGGRAWRPWVIAGAITIVTYVGPFLPVLFTRASSAFLRVMPLAYLAASLVLLVLAAFNRGAATAAPR